MLEKCKSAVDNKKPFGELLTDLPKAFDRVQLSKKQKVNN